jgi:hypothetical protein
MLCCPCLPVLVGSTICIVEETPIAAIILHASIRDVDSMVIVNGVIRKEKGQLAAVVTDGNLENLIYYRSWQKAGRSGDGKVFMGNCGRFNVLPHCYLNEQGSVCTA